MIDPLNTIPSLGVGFSYRSPLQDCVSKNAGRIECLELIPEHFLYGYAETMQVFEELNQQFPIVWHGLNLCLTTKYPNLDYLCELKKLIELTKSPYYTDHLALTGTPGLSLGHLCPIRPDRRILSEMVNAINFVQEFLGVPLVLENITNTFQYPQSEMTDLEFISQLTSQTGCGLLLDITNLHIVSTNFGLNAPEYLKQLPLEHVVQVHLSGGYTKNKELIDSHSELIAEESWDLFQMLLNFAEPKTVIIEHDSNFPPETLLMAQLDRLKELFYKNTI